MSQRIVITGLGFISPVGSQKQDVWAALEQSKSKPQPYIDGETTGFDSKCGYFIPRTFNITDYSKHSSILRKEKFSKYLVAAGAQCIADSGLDLKNDVTPDRIGSIVTTVNGPIDVTFKYLSKLEEKGPKFVSPNYFQQTVFNVAVGQLSIVFNLKGPSSTLVGCSSVEYASRFIREGKAEVMLACGIEEMHPHIYYGFDQSGMLSKDDGQSERCVPFSSRANGTVLGEGSTVVMLESEEHARKRDAHIYAEVVDFKTVTDPCFNKMYTEIGKEKRNSFSILMTRILEKNSVKPEDVNFISAAANSIPNVDETERDAIGSVFDNNKVSLVVSKAIFGETLGNSEINALAAAALCFEKNDVPPVRYLAEESGSLTNVGNTKKELSYALVNSMYIGGNICTTLLKKYK